MSAPTIPVLLFDGFDELDAVGPYESSPAAAPPAGWSTNGSVPSWWREGRISGTLP